MQAHEEQEAKKEHDKGICQSFRQCANGDAEPLPSAQCLQLILDREVCFFVLPLKRAATLDGWPGTSGKVLGAYICTANAK